MSNPQFAKLDNFDNKILALMQQSNRITSDQIAEQIGLSPAAVQRRLKRLREQKMIHADVSIINPKAVGIEVTLVVQVTLEREQANLLDNFKKEMRSNTSVQQCYYVTGSTDFILIVTAKNMKDYEDFTNEVFFNNPNIRNFQTNVVMDPVKIGLTVPIPL